MSAAYNEGVLAAKKGVLAESNPHRGKNDVQAVWDWNKGWMDQQLPIVAGMGWRGKELASLYVQYSKSRDSA